MTSSAIHLSFDGGWSDGDPGDGRLRFDSPNLPKVRNLYINAVDAQEALLGSLVPTWKEGDVLVIERPSAEKNRLVAWIMGRIVHGGSYYKIPLLVRSVSGGFAAHDELMLHHYQNLPDTEPADPAEWTPPARKQITAASSPPPLPSAPLVPMVAEGDRAAIARLEAQVQALKAELDAMRVQRALPAPGARTDSAVLDVIQGMLTGLEQMDNRLRYVEAITNTIRSLAEIKGAEEAA